MGYSLDISKQKTLVGEFSKSVLSAYVQCAQTTSLPPGIDVVFRLFSLRWSADAIDFLHVNEWEDELIGLTEEKLSQLLETWNIRVPTYEDVHYILNMHHLVYMTPDGEVMNEVVKGIW